MPLDKAYQNPHPAFLEGAALKYSRQRKVQPLVYVLWKDGRPIYAGSSQCVRERLVEHRWHYAFDEISYVCADTRQEAYDIEAAVIRLLEPKHNKRVTKRHRHQHFGRIAL